MRTRTMLTILITIILGVSSAMAQSPWKSVADVAPTNGLRCLTNMKEAFEPAKSIARKVIISAINDKGEKTECIGGQAYKNLPDGRKMILVMLEPEGVKGITFLFEEHKEKPSATWIYLPVLRRVRKISRPVEAYEPFLGTEFTYSDIGFVQLPKPNQCQLLETVDYKGIKTYKVEEKAEGEATLYFSRMVTWMDIKSFLPIKREYYDPAGERSKEETFKDVTNIEGITTVLLIQMKDLRQGFTTEFKISDVTYKAEIPDDLFDPALMSKAVNSPLWKAYSSKGSMK